jgi:hypothetical protein
MERNNSWCKKLEKLKVKAGVSDSVTSRFQIPQLGNNPYITLCSCGKRIEYAGREGKIILEYDDKKKEWNASEKEWGESSWEPKGIGKEERCILQKYWRILKTDKYTVTPQQ